MYEQRAVSRKGGDKKKAESVERKRHGSCVRPNRSMGDKHGSNEATMNPEWPRSWGPGPLLTNVLLTSHKQPVIETHPALAREEECER